MEPINFEDNRVSTSTRLKEFMLQNNLKQIDILNMAKPFCKKYNIKLEKNDLSQYVSGKVTPSQKKLSILAKALNVNPVWLMGYDIPSDPNIHILDIETYQIILENIVININKLIPITLDEVKEAQLALMNYYNNQNKGDKDNEN